MWYHLRAPSPGSYIGRPSAHNVLPVRSSTCSKLSDSPGGMGFGCEGVTHDIYPLPYEEPNQCPLPRKPRYRAGDHPFRGDKRTSIASICSRSKARAPRDANPAPRMVQFIVDGDEAPCFDVVSLYKMIHGDDEQVKIVRARGPRRRTVQPSRCTKSYSPSRTRWGGTSLRREA